MSKKKFKQRQSIFKTDAFKLTGSHSLMSATVKTFHYKLNIDFTVASCGNIYTAFITVKNKSSLYAFNIDGTVRK